MSNIYFALTEAFNATERVVALASGQAVVYYRVAIMSKDGDWVIRETPEACATILKELERRGAHYRPGAPLDIGIHALPLRQAHDRMVAIAERLLPRAPLQGSPDADAQ